MLKQFSQAVADGGSILGTILAVSTRQSTNKVPDTVPCSPSQATLYCELLRTAGITAYNVACIEVHGMGTPVKGAFGGTARLGPLHLGSVEGNIGHIGGASGVAGLIKTILMMRNRAIPKQANYVSPYPRIGLVPVKIDILTRKLPLDCQRALVACVTNYGAAVSIAATYICSLCSTTSFISFLLILKS